ncbi:hypothetical protein [Haliangium ochraceum]|uniref:Uncharacterized protein n=1 Tax=Haliangium ochraceum (strain DSM 14365 / JCM 11303 / SMP-2) TaxID=502025 RepID=D0LX94_HALO1|nr:hypothetical protein [Haliangium ochraceum]ACY16136.1 hypothetical protein Hoch_3634 [Haliangium ochraceum DSM 14365]
MKWKIGFALALITGLAAGCTAESPTSVGQAQEAATLLADEQDPGFSIAEANVLIVGDAAATSAMNTLRNHLQANGHTATLVYGAVPSGLSAFNTIWVVRANTPLSAGDRSLLLDFLAEGGGIHLSGENSFYDPLNDALNTFVQEAVIDSGGLRIGRQGDVSGFRSPYYPTNGDAIADVTVAPQATELIELQGAGGIGGLSPNSNHTLAVGGFFGNQVVAAAWSANQLTTGAGKLSVVMDTNWISKLGETDNDNADLLLNLQEFLTGEVVVNQPPVAVAELPDGQDLDCDDGTGEARQQVPVLLDGAGSSDPDGDALNFAWFRQGQFLGAEPQVEVLLPIGTHTLTLIVDDGEFEDVSQVDVEITCNIACTPGDGLFNRCHPGCPCDHSEGDCDTDADCLPGLICLHDAGFAFGYEDDEVDVCSNVCPELGVGAWNYCSPECPCSAGEGDCESDDDCAPGLRCVSDIGPAFGFQREVDVCEPG